jgi:uncharacterized protein YciI
MSYYAVTRVAGPAWTDGGIAAQPALDDHATFMNSLADRGVVLFAGPLAGTERGHLRALVIVNADTEDEIRTRLAADPWTVSRHLQIESIQPWNIFVGAERLPLQAGNTVMRLRARRAGSGREPRRARG